jgi:hypothetical protein
MIDEIIESKLSGEEVDVSDGFQDSDSELEEQKFFDLTDENKAEIRKFFAENSECDLAELTKKIFGRDDLNGRTREGRAVKRYIAEFHLGKVRTTTPELGPFKLTEAQVRVLENELVKKDFNAYETAKKVFKNDLIYKSSREVKTIHHYVSLIKKAAEEKADKIKNDMEVFGVVIDDSKYKKGQLATEEYRPPASPVNTIARVNKYLNLGWKEEKLKKIELKRIQSLMGYLRVFRFKYQINSYSRLEDRELFEDAFIRYTYDKEDLTQEELDQFITLANEVVIAADIQRRIDFLRRSLDDVAQESDGKKISMGLNEAINNAQTEYNQCIGRQEKLYKSLTIHRSKRIEQMKSENASILNLVFAWKQEEYRAKMIALAEKQKESLSEEVEKMSSVEEWKAVIKGLDPREVLS